MPPRVLNGDHNGGVTENTFFHHLRQKEDLNKRKAKLASDEKAWQKNAKDDGIDMDDLKWALKQRSLTIEEQVASNNRRKAYLTFMKVPMGREMLIVGDIKDEVGLTDEERQQKWEDEGYVAGREGKGRDVCPHEDPNSMGARHWMAGYDRGQAENAKGIRQKPKDKPKEQPAPVEQPAPTSEGPKDEPEVAEAKARGRPKKSGVTYWHRPDVKRVYELTIADATPEGAVSITRQEYEKLKADYDAAEEEEWGNPASDHGDKDDDEGDEPTPPTMN